MKLPLMSHQVEALSRQQQREFYALFCEQGTGKSVMLMADFEQLYEEGKITGVLVVAPKGVHTNWVNRELPKHLTCPYNAIAYKANVKYVPRALNDMHESNALRIFTINIEAAVTKKGREMVLKFLRKNQTYMIVDESQRIKSPDAARSRSILSYAPLAAYRRIATGTPATNAPADVFNQFEFLGSGLLGTTSYRAFVAEYTQLLPQDHPLVQHIKEQTKKRNVRPMIPAKDELGNPIYRNLDQLHDRMEPHSYRVKKADCLDLPDKIYKVYDFELTPEQRRAYDSLKNDLRFELTSGDPTTIKKLAMGTKLQQVTSNFILIDGEPCLVVENNPRMELFAEIIKDLEGQFIVWCKFIHEIEAVMELLESMKISCAGYYGKVSAREREKTVDGFQSGEIRALVGQPKAGGVGLTLTAAETAIYYSNDFSLEDRLQSEDRCHRVGTAHHVVYIDLIARNTIDERIHGALETKSNMAAAIVDELQPQL